jgi:thioredoxin reductase (NADPH)
MVAPGGGERPLLLAVDPDPRVLGEVESELQRGFGSDFRVRGELEADDAVRTLTGAAERDEPVAVVLVSASLDDPTAGEVLGVARARHPEARRALLVPWGAWADPDTAARILHGMAVGDIHYYVLRPWVDRDDLFRRTVAEFVQDWSRADPRTFREVVVVADRHSPRGFAVSDLLNRNRIPYAFRDRDSEWGRAVLDRTGHPDGEVVVYLPALDGRWLVDPTDAEVVEAWGLPTRLDDADRDVDVVLIGAGPAGLAAAVYAASEGLRTLVVEREAVGGQAGTSSLIRNYFGFSRGLGGAELAQRGYQQAWVFGARFLLMHEVEALRPEGEGLVVSITGVGDVRARAVVLSMGVSYRRLGVPSVEELTGKGVYYGASVTSAHALRGLRAAVVGGGNSAGQAVLQLARHCQHVHLVVRGPDLAATMSAYLIDAIAAEPAITVLPDTEVVDGSGTGRLERVTVRNRTDGTEQVLDMDGLFVMIGASPRTDWLPAEVHRDDHGFVLTGSDAAASGAWPADRPPEPYETTLPGVLAVGDVRSGSVKRVAAAVGEGSVSVSHVHRLLAARRG